jgi:hypothetical protein
MHFNLAQIPAADAYKLLVSTGCRSRLRWRRRPMAPDASMPGRAWPQLACPGQLGGQEAITKHLGSAFDSIEQPGSGVGPH